MIDTLKLPTILKKVCNDPGKPNSAFLELEIVPGEIFKIDPSMLQELCDELKCGISLIECGRTNILPYGVSRDAKIENGRLSIRVEVLKGLKLGGQHSFASTDSVIKVINAGIVKHFFIGLGNVICECDKCQETLFKRDERRCGHWPGEKDKDGSVFTYTIKKALPVIVSSVTLKVRDYENIELLTQLEETSKIDRGIPMKRNLERGPRIITKSSDHRFD